MPLLIGEGERGQTALSTAALLMGWVPRWRGQSVLSPTVGDTGGERGQTALSTAALVMGRVPQWRGQSGLSPFGRVAG
jgi:hypothetical protein